MFSKFCYDAIIEEHNDLKIVIHLENMFAFHPSEDYDEIYKKALKVKENRKYLSNNDRVKFSENIVSSFSPYKLENYCCNKEIIIKIIADHKEANVLISDPIDTLSIIETCVETELTLIPIENLGLILTASSTINLSQCSNDFIALNDEQYQVLKKYYPNLCFDKQRVKIIWTPTKEGHLNVMNSPSFKALFHFFETGQHIIDAEDFQNEIHRDSTVIDIEIFDSITQMLQSPDPETVNMAINIVTDCNREKSMPFLIALYHSFKGKFSSCDTSSAKEFKKLMSEIVTYQMSTKKLKDILKLYADETTLELLNDRFVASKV
jgi:hypothetical protein